MPDPAAVGEPSHLIAAPADSADNVIHVDFRASRTGR
jgi:hypothetical protein